MTDQPRLRPVVLCILDGWGHREDRDHNAVRLGKTPVMDRLLAEAPRALLDASEGAVGLPGGQMGNSEVGHMNLGAGRVVFQDLPRIDAAIAAGRLAGIPELRDFAAKLRASGGTAHILGLLSPGGVHAHQSHMAALAAVLKAADVPVALHALLDGRDTPPRSALAYLDRFRAEAPGIAIATVGGRYYAMDRDQNWDRVSRAHAALVEGTAQAGGRIAADAESAVRASYDDGVDDEFVPPTAIAGYGGMADGDGLLMANFRADRAREILTALLDPCFAGFGPSGGAKAPAFAAAAGMVSYADALDPFLTTLFPPVELPQTLGEAVSAAGKLQLRIAETEKYAHVTVFLNGGQERAFDGEERILVPSPKVATYDLRPEMSAPEVTDRLVAAIESGRFDLIVANYANCDMVGHSGRLDAAIAAVETVDRCLGRVLQAIAAAGGCALVTADHGNAEQMADPATGQPHTAHTTNPVPVALAHGPAGVRTLAGGKLADVAPTLLALMGLEQPEEMTGTSLLREAMPATGTGERAAE